MKQRVFDILDLLLVEYQNYEHVPVFSCDDAKGVDIPGKRVKSLLIRNKKASNYYMVVLPDYKKLDTNIIRDFFSDTKLSFASPERMLGLIKVTPGTVSPYALINNEEKNIIVIIDAELVGQDIGLHPLQNDNTVVTGVANIEVFLKHLGFDYHFIEL